MQASEEDHHEESRLIQKHGAYKIGSELSLARLPALGDAP